MNKNIVFFGTSEFGAIILEKMVQAGYSPVLVVTTPDMPSGRKQLLSPSPVKISAQKLNISVLQPEKLGLAKLNLAKPSLPHPDLFIVASYGKILPQKILDIPTHGTLNVHPSLLPKYRGPSPVQAVILNGEEETGATIMLLDEKMDHGAILAQQELKISKPTYIELHNTLAEIGANLLIETIPHWLEGALTPITQDHSKATYTKHIKKEDGHIDWKNPALYIERQVRAFNPWPGTYTTFQGKLLKILKARVLEQTSSKKLGETFKLQTGEIAVQTGSNALLVEELQLEGKKLMPSKEFLLGYKNFIGAILC